MSHGLFHTRSLKFPISGKHLRFQAEHSDHTAFPLRSGIYLTWIAHSFRNQLSAALFQDRYIML